MLWKSGHLSRNCMQGSSRGMLDLEILAKYGGLHWIVKTIDGV